MKFILFSLCAAFACVSGGSFRGVFPLYSEFQMNRGKNVSKWAGVCFFATVVFIISLFYHYRKVLRIWVSDKYTGARVLAANLFFAFYLHSFFIIYTDVRITWHCLKARQCDYQVNRQSRIFFSFCRCLDHRLHVWKMIGSDKPSLKYNINAFVRWWHSSNADDKQNNSLTRRRTSAMYEHKRQQHIKTHTSDKKRTE